jgi:NDP-sugar pyrophosphorylase family protein
MTRVTISLGYLGHLVEAVIGNGSRMGLDVSYTREETPLGTAGALSLIPFELADDDTVLVMNGDTLTSTDLGALCSWFESTDVAAAMVCVRREVKIDYGVVLADEAGRLVEIREKPTTMNTLSTGINIFRGKALGHLPPGRVDMPDFLMSLVDAGDPVLCRVVDDLWMDLGRVEDLAAANDLIAQNRL